jgi:DNA-binding MarR family transcriptional regulator
MQFGRITRRLAEAERPILTQHGLTMWEYIVLASLARRPAETQLALAEAIGYDKTRLIGLLDRLGSESLIARDPDPSDRRARIVALTAAGRKRLIAARRDIHAMEDELLAGLSSAERALLDAALARLADPA